jgi:hypothetical protein
VVGSFAVGLAVIAGLVLVYEFFWWVIGTIVLVLAIYILYDNLRELTRPSGAGVHVVPPTNRSGNRPGNGPGDGAGSPTPPSA